MEAEPARVDRTGLTRPSDEWMEQAACAFAEYEGGDPFCTDRQEKRDVRDICRSCPVAWDCLVYAIHHGIGIDRWGGMDPDQRTAFRRQYPRLDGGVAKRSHSAFLNTTEKRAPVWLRQTNQTRKT